MNVFEILKAIVSFGVEVYMYCTDIIIHVSNLTGLAYYEDNFIIFGLAYPALFFILSLLVIFQKVKYAKLKAKRK